MGGSFIGGSFGHVKPSIPEVGRRMFHFGGRQQMREPVSFPGGLKIGLATLAAALFLSPQVKLSAQQKNAPPAVPSPTLTHRQFLDRYCAACHNDSMKT